MKSLLRKTPKKNVSKYSGVETRAIELLSEYSQGSIDNDLFGEQMENVAKDLSVEIYGNLIVGGE